jgi:hypothetical protein
MAAIKRSFARGPVAGQDILALVQNGTSLIGYAG